MVIGNNCKHLKVSTSSIHFRKELKTIKTIGRPVKGLNALTTFDLLHLLKDTKKYLVFTSQIVERIVVKLKSELENS